MLNFEIFGILLIVIAIVYSFYRKEDRVGFALIIVLLVLLLMLGYLSPQ